MIRRLTIGTAGAALLLTGVSAQQAAADPPCYTGEVCVYYRGALVSKFPPVPSGSCRYVVAHYFDKVVNRSSRHQRAWSGTNCTGRNVLVYAGSWSYVNLFWSMGGE